MTVINPSNNLAVEVRQTGDKGQGVFSTRNFAKNEIVIVGKPVSESDVRTWQTLQMDIDTHVRMDVPFELVNHSCDPNCGLKLNKFNGYNLVALKSIRAGDEITFDYCMSEWISIAVESCQCNSDICRKTIRGGKFLSDDILNKYDGYIAPYYKKLIFSS